MLLPFVYAHSLPVLPVSVALPGFTVSDDMVPVGRLIVVTVLSERYVRHLPSSLQTGFMFGILRPVPKTASSIDNKRMSCAHIQSGSIMTAIAISLFLISSVLEYVREDSNLEADSAKIADSCRKMCIFVRRI